jgi:hypothetical protein
VHAQFGGLFCIAYFESSALVRAFALWKQFVALCDNKYPGIVPVPAKIGNGQYIKQCTNHQKCSEKAARNLLVTK